ncbi:MAG: diaminopimelate decarboxylase [Ferrimicrobium sp.]
MLGALPHRLAPETASLDDLGHLSIGGCPVSELADRYGTPLFIYDEAHLRNALRQARDAFSGNIVYASKAFGAVAMARLVADAGLWWDASSAGELSAALRGGIPGARIVMHGNNKSDAELVLAIESGVHAIVVDSFDEIDRLTRLASFPVSVWLRVTPGIEAHTHAYVRTGQQDSKFGFDLQGGEVDRAVSLLRASPMLRLIGLHAHIGSQIFILDSFAEVAALMVGLAHKYQVVEVSLGGGLGVPYVRGESSPSVGEWAEWISTQCQAAGARDLSLFIEPGRAIVATAAVTLYRIGVVKTIPGLRRYVAVDGGMSDNPRPVLYGSGYEAVLPCRLREAHDTSATVVGKHCESGDVLVEAALLPASVVADELLLTPVTGAYGYSMGSNYNRLPRPAVVFVDNGHDRLVVRKEEIDDLFRLEVEEFLR